MFLLLLLSATTVLALASNPDDDIHHVDQNWLQTTKTLKENMDRMAQDSKANAKRAEVNLEQILQNANANFKRSEISSQQIIQNANDNAKRTEASLNENTRVLKQILQALGAVRKGTSYHPTTKWEEMATIIPTTQLTPVQPIQAQRGRDCAELYTKGERANGAYLADTRESFQVYCDMETDGGGWTVFQRRGDFGFPVDYFYRNWTEYKKGFGELDKEFWLGNDKIWALAHQKPSQLRVDLWDMGGEQRFAKYSTFRIEDESSNYRLMIDGYTGDAGDSLSHHSEEAFTTKDRPNGRGKANCAGTHRGAWWFGDCGYSNLNGLNLRGLAPDPPERGILWDAWKGRRVSLASTEMKMRPANF